MYGASEVETTQSHYPVPYGLLNGSWPKSAMTGVDGSMAWHMLAGADPTPNLPESQDYRR